MGFFVIGVNHQTADVEIRERLNFAPEQVPQALASAVAALDIEELVILSTCNRTEVFFVASKSSADISAAAVCWLKSFHGLEHDKLSDEIYCYENDVAIHHLISVSSGLNSMVLGEPQIFGQVKSAYATAVEHGFIGSALAPLFQHVFSICKRVRSETAIGENPVSIAYVAARMAQRIFSKLADTKALLIGAGETIELVAGYLREQGVQEVIVANRTLSRAAELAEKIKAESILLSDIPERLHEADIVISSTASQLPILGKGAVESALKLRKRRPILMIDIAVPRDIEAEVGNLRDIYLYSIDDLSDIIEENQKARADEARRADQIIEQGVLAYRERLKAQSAVPDIRLLRSSVERVRDEEMAKALKMLANGSRPEEVVARLANSLMNKIIHQPSVRIKKASVEDDAEALRLIREIFSLNDINVGKNESFD